MTIYSLRTLDFPRMISRVSSSFSFSTPIIRVLLPPWRKPPVEDIRVTLIWCFTSSRIKRFESSFWTMAKMSFINPPVL